MSVRLNESANEGGAPSSFTEVPNSQEPVNMTTVKFFSKLQPEQLVNSAYYHLPDCTSDPEITSQKDTINSVQSIDNGLAELDIFDYDFNQLFDKSRQIQTYSRQRKWRENKNHKMPVERLFSSVFDDMESNLENDSQNNNIESISTTSSQSQDAFPRAFPRRKRVVIEDSEDDISDTELVSNHEQSTKHRPTKAPRSRNERNDFIINDVESDYDHRHRRTTLEEIQERRKVLKGVLPLSFANVFKKQLIEEKQMRHGYQRSRLRDTNHSNQQNIPNLANDNESDLHDDVDHVSETSILNDRQLTNAKRPNEIFDFDIELPELAHHAPPTPLTDLNSWIQQSLYVKHSLCLWKGSDSTRLSPFDPSTSEPMQILGAILWPTDDVWRCSVVIRSLFWRLLQVIKLASGQTDDIYRENQPDETKNRKEEEVMVKECAKILSSISKLLIRLNQLSQYHHDNSITKDTLECSDTHDDDFKAGNDVNNIERPIINVFVEQASNLCERVLALHNFTNFPKIPRPDRRKLPPTFQILILTLLCAMDWAVFLNVNTHEYSIKRCIRYLERIILWMNNKEISNNRPGLPNWLWECDPIVIEAWQATRFVSRSIT